MTCFESIFIAPRNCNALCFITHIYHVTALCCPLLISPVKDIFNVNERFTFTNKG